MGICIGVDVAKAHLDWVLGPKGKVERIPNTKAAVRKLHELDFDRVVLESTGQYERLLFEALGDEGITVVRMNPVRVRRFGEGMGVLAKNDSIDARMLALFGEKAEPEERPVTTAREREMGDMIARRRQLILNLTQEKNRLEHASKCVVAEMRGLIRILANRVKKLDLKIDSVIAQDAKQHADLKRLQSVAHSGDRERSFRSIVNTRFGDRERSGATLDLG